MVSSNNGGWQPVPKVWSGERVFIIGGGPSARGLEWELFRGKEVMACNAAAFLLPKGIVKWAVFGDKPFLRMFRHPLREYVNSGGQLINATGRPIEPMNHWMIHIKRLERRKNWGIKTDPREGVSWNRSTGGCAINLAVQMGAGELVLVGFDMCMEQRTGKHNWHDEYLVHYEDGKMSKPDAKHYRLNLVQAFDEIAIGLKFLKIPCWNVNENSALRCIPFKSLGELL